MTKEFVYTYAQGYECGYCMTGQDAEEIGHDTGKLLRYCCNTALQVKGLHESSK